jgi:hypothetical protein
MYLGDYFHVPLQFRERLKGACRFQADHKGEHYSLRIDRQKPGLLIVQKVFSVSGTAAEPRDINAHLDCMEIGDYYEIPGDRSVLDHIRRRVQRYCRIWEEKQIMVPQSAAGWRVVRVDPTKPFPPRYLRRLDLPDDAGIRMVLVLPGSLPGRLPARLVGDAPVSGPTAAEVRQARAQAAMTQTEAAAVLGWTLSAWQKIEYGLRPMSAGAFSYWKHHAGLEQMEFTPLER